MKANSTPLKDFKFVNIATAAKNWKEKAATLEGVVEKEPTFLYFRLWVPNQKRSIDGSNIETARAKYDIVFNLDGSVKKFDKN